MLVRDVMMVDLPTATDVTPSALWRPIGVAAGRLLCAPMEAVSPTHTNTHTRANHAHIHCLQLVSTTAPSVPIQRLVPTATWTSLSRTVTTLEVWHSCGTARLINIPVPCSACEAHCVSCSDGNTCTACEPGYDLFGGDCNLCGDGVLEGAEECDDNNTLSGDGCNSTCGVESGDGWVCSSASPSVCQRKYCSGVVLLHRRCDTDVDANVCYHACTVCGNGVVEGTEECDDNNTVGGDGCRPNCTIDTSRPWTCSSAPSVCQCRQQCHLVSTHSPCWQCAAMVFWRERKNAMITAL